MLLFRVVVRLRILCSSALQIPLYNFDFLRISLDTYTQQVTSAYTLTLVSMLDLVAILSSGLFCGAALYVSAVEHPARMQMPIREAARQFGKSYPRAAVMQPIYVALTCIASATKCLKASTGVQTGLSRSKQAHALNLVFMAGCFIWTVAVMLPGNKALLKAERESDVCVKHLLQAWGRQHALRTIASLVASIVLLSACIQGRD